MRFLYGPPVRHMHTRMRRYIATVAAGQADGDNAGYECLLLNQFPFNEDMREFSVGPVPGARARAAACAGSPRDGCARQFADFTTNDKFQPSATQLEAAERLIRSMDLVAGAPDGKPFLRPADTFNPYYQRLYQAIVARALDERCALPPLDPLIAAGLEPPAAVAERARTAVNGFMIAFPLVKVVVAPPNKKRRFWGARRWRATPPRGQGAAADAWVRAHGTGAAEAGGGGLAVAAGAPVKKARGDEDADVSLESALGRKVDSVGVVAPDEDFRAMMSRRDVVGAAGVSSTATRTRALRALGAGHH